MSLAWLLAPFTVGLFGGTHCITMCGGVVAMTCSSLPLDRRRRARAQVPFLLAYNAGRIASYSAAGLAMGAVGATVAHIGAIERAQLALRVVAGVMMLALGAYVSGLAASLRWIEHAGRPIWRRIEPTARKLLPVRSPAHAFALGALWGFMPCGLVYAALALSLGAGSPIAGAATMAAFGIGTLPMLLSLGSAAAIVVQVTRSPGARRAAGVAMIALGLVHVAQTARVWHAVAQGAERVCCFHHHLP